MARIEFIHVKRSYANGVTALEDVSFQVEDGEFFVVIAPVGGGKTVLLKLAAGLEVPESGQILFDGQEPDSDLSERGVAMMFQHYGLRPNMTVYGNLALGLKLRGSEKGEIDARVRDAARELDLTAELYKKPKKLSPLQQKKAELARALVRMPRVFLLDEPLGGLSPAEREKMRAEIARIHQLSGTTFLYATREWQDAKQLAGRVLVMNGGEVMGCGTPQDLYDNPPNLFTAAFLGEPPMNLVASGFIQSWNGKEGILGFRPEHATVLSEAAPKDTTQIYIPAIVIMTEKQDKAVLCHLKIEGKDSPVMANPDNGKQYETGSQVQIVLDPDCVHVFEESKAE